MSGEDYFKKQTVNIKKKVGSLDADIGVSCDFKQFAKIKDDIIAAVKGAVGNLMPKMPEMP